MKYTKKTTSKRANRFFQMIGVHWTNTCVQVARRFNDLRLNTNENKKIALIYLHNRR